MRRRNPRLMPVSESDLNSLTHKAIQILRTGLAFKLRREQQFWERKRKRASDGVLPEPYPSENSKINYKTLSEFASDTLTGSTVINQAGFVYQDIRGQQIDALLQVLAKKGDKWRAREYNIYVMEEMDFSQVVERPQTKTQKNQTSAFYAICFHIVHSGVNLSRSRLIGEKKKQNVLGIDFIIQDWSFESIFKIINVPKNSFAYQVLFNAVKVVVYHEFIHSMEAMPRELTPEQGAKKFRPTQPVGYYDQVKERRAFLSEVLNEILYYNTRRGVLQKSFYNKRPDVLADDSPQFRRMLGKMSEDTEHYFYQAIYQFQKEYDPKTFVHFMPLHEDSVKKGRRVLNRYWLAEGKAQNRIWEQSLKPPPKIRMPTHKIAKLGSDFESTEEITTSGLDKLLGF